MADFDVTTSNAILYEEFINTFRSVGIPTPPYQFRILPHLDDKDIFSKMLLGQSRLAETLVFRLRDVYFIAWGKTGTHKWIMFDDVIPTFKKERGAKNILIPGNKTNEKRKLLKSNKTSGSSTNVPAADKEVVKELEVASAANLGTNYNVLISAANCSREKIWLGKQALIKALADLDKPLSNSKSYENRAIASLTVCLMISETARFPEMLEFVKIIYQDGGYAPPELLADQINWRRISDLVKKLPRNIELDELTTDQRDLSNKLALVLDRRGKQKM